MQLTAIERDTLKRMAEADEPLVRWEGGYWTLDGQHASGHAWPSGYALPRWYVGFGAVRALEDKGLVRRLHRFAEAWRDSRELTDNGRLEAAGQAAAASPSTSPQMRMRVPVGR